MSGGFNFHFMVRDLAHEVDAGRMTNIEAAGRVAEGIHKALQCVHVTFWNVSGSVGHREMRSVVAYDGTRLIRLAGAAAFPEAGGGFFGPVLKTGCYVCPDTFADPALQAVRDTMLKPFNIHALLSASYGINGQVWGLITCTHDTPRRWQSHEVTALRKCAAEISALRARQRSLGSWLSAEDVGGR